MPQHRFSPSIAFPLPDLISLLFAHWAPAFSWDGPKDVMDEYERSPCSAWFRLTTLRRPWIWTKDEITVCIVGSRPSEKGRSWCYSMLRVSPKVMLWHGLSDPKVSFAPEDTVSSHIPGTIASLRFYRFSLLSYSTAFTPLPVKQMLTQRSDRLHFCTCSQAVPRVYPFILDVKIRLLDLVWDWFLVSFTIWHLLVLQMVVY